MKLSISQAALLAQLFLSHSLAASVLTNSNIETLNSNAAPPTRRSTDNAISPLLTRQVPVSSNNDPPRGATPGGSTAPKDMQPKPNDNLPQPVPVIPGGSGSGTTSPKGSTPVKPPVAGRVMRRSRVASDIRVLSRRDPQQAQAKGVQAHDSAPPSPQPKEASPPSASSMMPPPSQQSPPPPHSGPPGNNDNDPVLPNIIPQPNLPGVPKPRVPVPVETDRPAPMALSG